jgi:molybdate transport system substrate-binding protein
MAVLLVAGACSSSSPRLTVFAAASVSRALHDDGRTRYSFAGSQQVVAQVEAGAPADVVITADEDSMARLRAARRVRDVVDVATNSLVIVVRRGNPLQVHGLGDLGGPEVRLVLADPSVPAGKYAAAVLQRAGVHANPVSLELDVESAVQKVALGQADAAIAYATDAHARGVEPVAIPPAQNVLARYPAGVLVGTRHLAAARRFLASLPARLQAAGFGAP